MNLPLVNNVSFHVVTDLVNILEVSVLQEEIVSVPSSTDIKDPRFNVAVPACNGSEVAEEIVNESRLTLGIGNESVKIIVSNGIFLFGVLKKILENSG